MSRQAAPPGLYRAPLWFMLLLRSRNIHRPRTR